MLHIFWVSHHQTCKNISHFGDFVSRILKSVASTQKSTQAMTEQYKLVDSLLFSPYFWKCENGVLGYSFWWSPNDIVFVWSKTRREKSPSQRRMLVWIRRKGGEDEAEAKEVFRPRRRLWEGNQWVQNVWRSQHDALRVYLRGVCC